MTPIHVWDKALCGRLPVLHHPCRLSPRHSLRPRLRVAAGIHIDRRQFLEHLLERQLECEAREAEATLSCPLECVREVYNYNEFEKVLHEADKANELVMVDFYTSSCGACKYLLPQVIRLCKKLFRGHFLPDLTPVKLGEALGCEDSCVVAEGRGLIFLKHNVQDEYDELTDLARFYAIRSVPVFTFFMNGSPIEHVFTKDKLRLEKAVCRIREERNFWNDNVA